MEAVIIVAGSAGWPARWQAVRHGLGTYPGSLRRWLVTFVQDQAR